MLAINIIAQAINNNKAKLDDFFAKKSNIVYGSIDVRHAGFKIAPVDTNCFPAGFNNLDQQNFTTASSNFAKFFTNFSKKIAKILIIAENHSRNQHYFQNLAVLQNLLQQQNYQVRIANWHLEQQLNIANINIYPMQNIDGVIHSIDFVPDFLLLNNDLTDGLPTILQNIKQPIAPNPNLGWHSRSKARHFDYYNSIACEVAELINLDSWLFSTYHDLQSNIDFKNKLGIEELANKTQALLDKIAIKYQQYNIKQQPYCYIKANNGTYGMAVWSVFSAEDVLHINKKDRNKMNMLKNSVENHQVILQEGIATIDSIDSAPCESLLYLINSNIVDDFFRVNKQRNASNSLNAIGADFIHYAQLPSNSPLQYNKSDLQLVHWLIANICMLAVEYESTKH
jgi:glutamate--cysteine ligase